MTERPLKHHETPEARIPRIETLFSKEREIERVKQTLERRAWFVEQGYRFDLPKALADASEIGREITDADIESAVAAEFDPAIYKETSAAVLKGWDEVKAAYFGKLRATGLPFPDEYAVVLTRYGVGGSYRPPNRIILNLNRPPSSVVSTVFHEAVHLAIEDRIQAHGIDHWTKERLVDLLVSGCTGKREMQRDFANAEAVERIYRDRFPDVEGIFAEIEALPKSG